MSVEYIQKNKMENILETERLILRPWRIEEAHPNISFSI